MAEQPPPPYTDRYVRHIKKDVPNETHPTTASSTQLYSHPREVYIAVIAFKSTGRLYLWSPDLAIDATLTPIPIEFQPAEGFGMVQGFQEFSSSEIPRDVLQDPENIGKEALDLLDRRIKACAARNDQPSSEGSTQVGHDALVCSIYKIHLFSKWAQSLTDEKAFALLFRWTKSSSVYGDLRGPWEAGLVDVIRNGMFSAGAQLRVLVRGVSKEQMEELRRKWQEGTRVMEF